MKLGRNDPCHCGSGQKYKKCHAPADDAQKSAELAAQAAARAAVAAQETANAEASGQPAPSMKVDARQAPLAPKPKAGPPRQATVRKRSV